MKIFYAIQATGNGHISRAMELLPHLAEYGQVDLFLSGANSNLALDAPIKYRSQGLSLFYNCNGGLDYLAMLRNYHPLRLRQEIRDLPVEKYDLVINDFDYVTAAACASKRVPSVNYGHQASFLSPHTPRPVKRNRTGEWILKNYARATQYVGLHFDRYDDFIFTPVIKREIRQAEPSDGGYITVYLPSYCKPQLEALFRPFRDVSFQIFTHEVRQPVQAGHIRFMPVDKALFNASLLRCSGLVTGGGFETPAEAIHLGKKILSIPIRGQYEQACNSAALELLGVTCRPAIGPDFPQVFESWMNGAQPVRRDYSHSIGDSLQYLFSLPRVMPGDVAPVGTAVPEPWKI